jgi:hypothetical protein
MSDLFNNAVASIRMGVEDYTNKDGNRALSAVRNFYSGVLLLAKEVLVRTTPEARMQDVLAAKYKPVPDGKGGIEYVPENQQTIDFSTLGKRFKDFGLPLDQKALEELNRVRNDIEHRYTAQTDDAVREAIARAFPVTADLFRQLGENPSEILGEAWQLMLDTRHLYDREVQQCRNSRAAIQWYSRTIQGAELQCTSCGSNLVEQIDSSNSIQSRAELRCCACGARLETEEVIVAVLADALAGEAYVRFKDGGEDGPIYPCPDCSHEAYVDLEGGCAVCGHKIKGGSCVRCGSPLTMNELTDGENDDLCSYCAYVADKVMRE